jgi:hypothetical protein
MKTVLEYPSKMYPIKSGALFSSEQMAKIQEIGIKKLNDQLASTTNPKKTKLLKNRLREIKLWLLVHPDVKQFMK